MGDRDRGVTYIEMAITLLIVSIAVVSLVTALSTAFKGNLMAKDKSRAMALARDRVEEVKNFGYNTLSYRYSNYIYPDQPDPAAPLYQKNSAKPYPAVAPASGEDPWTAESLVLGGVTYWRHVVVKFVEEDVTGKLVQKPAPCPACSPAEPGGTNPGSNLALIEVDVTWYSRRLGAMQQVRVSTLLANTSVPSTAIGEISGTLIDDNVDGGADAACVSCPLPAVSPDDKPITWATFVVTARNLVTGDTFSTKSNLGSGFYLLRNLPYGGYYVEMTGLPSYRDSAYTGYNEPTTGATIKPVEISADNPTERFIDIFSTKVNRVTVHAKFQGVDGTSTAQSVLLVMDDGVSPEIHLSVTQLCSSAAPCYADIPNVAVPQSGRLNYTLWVENKTTPSFITAKLCVDSSITGGDFYMGWGASLPAGNLNTPCGAGACSALSSDSTLPQNTAGPVNVSGTTFQTSSVHVKVLEYYDGATYALAQFGLARVKMTGDVSGVTYTRTVNANGETLFSPADGTGVPVEEATNLHFLAWMTTTGYTSDLYTLPIGTVPGGSLDLQVGGTIFTEPGDQSQRHTFVLARSSIICGTVWSSTGVPSVGTVVRIHNSKTEWDSQVTTNAAGLYVHPAVPMDTTIDYTVAPQGGADFVSTPASRTVKVGGYGLAYHQDNSLAWLDFTFVAVNAVLQGQVYYQNASTRADAGAVVIASTYNGAFPTALPSVTLNGVFSYSTVALTDGSYSLKVASGIGNYYLYAFMVRDGVLHSYGPSAAIAVSAAAATTQNVTLP